MIWTHFDHGWSVNTSGQIRQAINGDFSIMTKKVDLNIKSYFHMIFDPNLERIRNSSAALTFRRRRAAKAQKSETTISFSLLQAVDDEFVDRVGTT